MIFDRPNLRDIIGRIVADIDARLPGADARLPSSNLNVLAYAQGGAVHGLYGVIEYLAKQIFPDTAAAENLDRWSEVWGVTRNAAAPAAGSVSFTGMTGGTIIAGTLLQRSDGRQYQTTSELTLVSGAGIVGVVAVLPGLLGGTDASVVLNLVTPVLGVNAGAVVASGGLTGGTDIETDDALRSRLLQRIRIAPHGGSEADYVAWALEVAGVTRAWVYPGELGAGTVVVRFVRDGDGVGAAIIPDAGEVAAVQSYLALRRPVTAALTVVAPVAAPLNFTIAGITPNTAAVKAAVAAELQDLLLRVAKPGGTVLLSHIRAAISTASGETDYVLTAPASNVVSALGNMSTMGVVTWV